MKNIGFRCHVGDMGGLNRAKYSYDVYKCFADQPGHPWDDGFLGIFLNFQNMKPFLTKHMFRRKHARYQIVFKSAIYDSVV